MQFAVQYVQAHFCDKVMLDKGRGAGLYILSVLPYLFPDSPQMPLVWELESCLVKCF